MTQQILHHLRRINQGIALVAGVALALCVGFILLEVLLRRVWHSVGGTDEISGYVMAAITAWGMAYALIEAAHVRIDILRTKLAQPGRVLLDLVAMASLAGVTLLIAAQSWPVLSRTLRAGARANTPLETPLWLPQLAWWSGWVWFAFSACVMLGCTLAMLASRRFDEAESAIGARSELEVAS